MPVDLRAIDADFYAWTGHKAYGPTGIGVLHGRRALLEEMPPFIGGGHMIRTVAANESTWTDLPWKFEAGTSQIAEAIGLGVAVDWLRELGMDAIRAHELGGHRRGARAARHRDSGPDDPRARSAAADRGALVSFALDGAHPHDVGEILGREGVCVRAGHHCAQPLMRRLGVSRDDAGVVRGAQHRRRRGAADRRAARGPPRHAAGLRHPRYAETEMDDLYRENILDHYKHPHNWSPPGDELADADLEFHDLNPLCGDELTVQPRGRRGRADRRRPLLRARVRDLAGGRLDGLRRGQRDDRRRAAEARPLVRARPARDRDLGDADEVRAAVPEGAQGRLARPRGRLGVSSARRDAA